MQHATQYCTSSTARDRAQPDMPPCAARLFPAFTEPMNPVHGLPQNCGPDDSNATTVRQCTTGSAPCRCHTCERPSKNSTVVRFSVEQNSIQEAGSWH
ncbi:protein of unknown function [Cupriavidus taiwanensis]|nr:protein of unknown function [Cupriavidus taiwanensis]SOZ03915.1 hypothetical protein CBM2597_A50091 [Cupriavidus taiwanensis]SOZ04470.1 hypothetical protein CBM2595_A50063 [Cupriavidus taiwanensis]